MNLVTQLEQYDESGVYFCDAIKNNVMTNSNFIRLVYSTPLFVLNGMYLQLKFRCTSVQRFYNKCKCLFDVEEHQELIRQVGAIEEGLLKRASIVGKTAQLKIHEQLKTGNVKLFADQCDQRFTWVVLKIAGIWETPSEYGLTYKFLHK